MKYIDAEKLIAEIERLYDGEVPSHGQQCEFEDGYFTGIATISKFIDSLQQEQPIGEEYAIEIGKHTHTLRVCSQSDIDNLIRQEKQEQPEVELEKFTQKMNDWKARYNHPYNIPIKATMAFTARMFYQYPNVARRWYDSLPKATMD